MSDIYTIPVDDIRGQRTTLAPYRGKVLLIVNVASECGFTPQYDGLERLHERYQGRGLEVLGFPCNQFGGQEPGTEAQIEDFCRTRFGVRFPMFAKVEVNGPGSHPLYTHLKQAKAGLLGSEAIKWNFTKFLVGRDGEVLGRYAPQTKPEDIAGDIERALG